ncbi:hypothetical protein CONPUDRAFT_59467 [Coniophora puteana RWD-64-598 SS2]|uniref:DNA breaking-rejoining enzyme n=1 Tax=Coniophora puteana (strain RWD-64-598) TaxID=741705 RepID=A0A5M3ML31_CONPW|nr:uncharacterized protein CONPUDRAFT_59467 [Coniophora puteana RWD-64-598 SS2]EIW79271.1 hypothetical protein CONPUDRAFT_59467 [Coniophora puteana RWD-64-598 SS2]
MSSRRLAPADRPTWSHEQLDRELAITLGFALDASSALAYSSALNAYTTFCRKHEFPIKPAPETFARFIVYMQHFVSPKTINSYLSGICNQLENLYPDVRSIRRSPMVAKTMKGSFRRFQTPSNRKDPLSRADLLRACTTLNPATVFDDALFIAQLLVGFYALMRSGELVRPDRRELHDYNKLSMRHSVKMSTSSISFTLPRHKADTTFEALAEDGVPFDQIQALGRWSSDAFKIYIRKHPALLASAMLAR